MGCGDVRPCVDEKFPAEAFERLGYNVAVHGQKTYNGVALLSKTPLEDVRRGLPGDDGDDHARYIEAVVSGPAAGAGRLASTCRTAIRSPPRSSPTSWPGWTGCTATPQSCWRWRSRWCCPATTTSSPRSATPSIPKNWVGRRPVPAARAAPPSAALKWLGLTDAYLQADGAPGAYTFWDYQAGAWQRNNGIRIDHALLSPQAADRLRGVASTATSAAGTSRRTTCR